MNAVHSKTEATNEMFEQAARNQGFSGMDELAEVSAKMTGKVDPAAVADDMDDPASAPITPQK